VLLGLRTAVKEDLGVSAAEMVYGDTLRLPGDFFHDEVEDPTTDEYVNRLRARVRQLEYVTPRHPPAEKQHVYVDPALHKCSHVFVRVDRVKRPLQRPYEGPFKVLDRRPKYFVVSYKGKRETISIDRLKTAWFSEELETKLEFPESTSNEPESQAEDGPDSVTVQVKPPIASDNPSTVTQQGNPSLTSGHSSSNASQTHSLPREEFDEDNILPTVEQSVTPPEPSPRFTRAGRRSKPPTRYADIQTINKEEDRQDQFPKEIYFNVNSGETAFLSNLYTDPQQTFEPMQIHGMQFRPKSAEHAYQSSLCASREGVLDIMEAPNGAQARRRAKKYQRVENADQRRLPIMGRIIANKFRRGTPLADKLLATGSAALFEKTDHRFWSYKGENHLGEILMNLREKLKKPINEEREEVLQTVQEFLK
jgi:predicted NAD-dependent protein-ADP-ribosyltransferase YbiA (DUF1768 family)